MDVSPGVVMASAPCAAPYSTAFCGSLNLHQAVDQPAGETVAAAHTVQNFQVLAVGRFVELAARPANRAPVIARGRLDRAQRGGDDFEVRVSLHRLADHFLEGRHIDPGEVFVRAFDLQAEAGGEVFLVADHDIHVPGNLPVDLLRALLAADAFPERRAIVEVVGDNGAVLPGGLHGFNDELGRGVAQRGEDAAGMQPARAELGRKCGPNQSRPV